MSLDLKYAIEASVFWPPSDRVVSSGYKKAINEDDVYKFVKSVEGVDGVELYFPYDFKDVGKMKKIIADNGLTVSAVGIGNFGEPQWQHGSSTSYDSKIRSHAMDLSKRTVEAASELGAKVVVFWPAHDGYDYFFQTDYQRKWDMLVEDLIQIASVNPDINIGIEYKPKEPRTHQLVPNASKALKLSEDTGMDNVGVIMDVGHSFLAHENPAEEAVYLMNRNRLVHLHSNDNYDDWDYDMIPGSVHFWQNIELFYWLDKLGYQGWINFDICPFREESVKACTLSIRHTKKLVEFAQKLDSAIMDKSIANNDALAAQEYLWKILF
ncbi:sugar phosphate isomerase/epimerase family protein [Planctomycetota bacterium]